MDPSQGLCLGALFDIAATNVSTLYPFFWLNLLYELSFTSYKYEMYSF